jgi:MFS family permease
MPERWKILIVLCLARVAMGFQFQAFGATGPALRAQYGLDLGAFGWLVGLYLLPGMAVALPSGMLGARFGERRIALAGLALMIAGGTALALAGTTDALALGRAVCGIGGVLFSVMVTKMLADWFVGHELMLATSILVNTWPIGIALALFTLGGVAELGGLTAVFATTVAFAGLSFALVATFYRPAPGASRLSKASLAAISRDEWVLLGLAGAAWMLFNVVYASFATFLPAWLVEQGVPAARANLTTGVNSLLIIIGVPLGGYLAQRAGRPALFAALSLGAACVSIGALLAFGPHPGLLLASGLLIGLPVGFIASMPAQFLRPQTRATGAGVWSTIFYLGMGLLPGPIGLAAQRYGTTSAVLVIAIGLALVAALATLAFPVLRQRLAASG